MRAAQGNKSNKKIIHKPCRGKQKKNSEHACETKNRSRLKILQIIHSQPNKTHPPRSPAALFLFFRTRGGHTGARGETRLRVIPGQEGYNTRLEYQKIIHRKISARCWKKKQAAIDMYMYICVCTRARRK